MREKRGGVVDQHLNIIKAEAKPICIFITVKREQVRYLVYAYYGGYGFPNELLVYLFDQHQKVLLEEFNMEKKSINKNIFWLNKEIFC